MVMQFRWEQEASHFHLEEVQRKDWSFVKNWIELNLVITNIAKVATCRRMPILKVLNLKIIENFKSYFIVIVLEVIAIESSN